MKLKEVFLKRIKSVTGKAVGFRIDTVKLPNGKWGVREYLNHPGAVAVIALYKNRILMVRQYRYPVQQNTWEIPAGKLSKGENPRHCVVRELKEETGYSAGRIRKLISFWPTAAFANEVIHIYVADQLKPGPANPDEDEFISCRAWSLNDLNKLIRSGKLKDSKTLIALMAYQLYKQKR